MNRRAFVIAGGSVFATVTAGCSDLQALDEGDRDEVPGYNFEELEAADVGVTDGYIEDETIHIEYTTTRTGDEAVSQVELVASAIADAISDPTTLEISANSIRVSGYDEEGEVVIEYSIRLSQAIDYYEGDIDEDEYIDEILESVETRG